MAVCFGTWGCRSPQDGSPSAFASVTIKDHSLLEIQKATVQVFHQHDYAKVEETVSPDFTFEKEGTKMNTFIYGGWMGKVWVRVKVYIEPQDAHVFLLRCDAYMVGDHGDAFVEEEHKLTKMRRGDYQDLLNEIKTSLSPPVEK